MVKISTDILKYFSCFSQNIGLIFHANYILHERLKPVFSGKKKKKRKNVISLLSAEFARDR